MTAAPADGRQATVGSTSRSPAAAATLALAAALAALAGVTSLVTLAHLGRVERIPGAGMWALAAGFAAAEVLPVHLEHRREALSVTLSTVPLVVGLYSVSPLSLVAARLLGSAVALIVHRRQEPLKLAVNLSSFWVQTVVSVDVFRMVSAHPTGSGAWPALLVAVLVGDVVQSVALGLAISVYQRRWEPGLGASSAVATGAAVVETSVALVVLALIRTQPAALAPMLVVTGLVLASYKTHRSFRQRHHDLEQLYDFASLMGDAVLRGDVVGALLSEARELMHAETARLLVRGADDVLSEVTADERGEPVLRPADPSLSQLDALARQRSEPLLLADAAARPVLPPGWAADGMIAPMNGTSGPIGCLVVTDRSGDVRPFGADDVRRFTTLAVHAGVALENSRLVERLRQKAAESEHASLHDALTGLPNRTLFVRDLDAALADGTPVAVLLLDLDRFKEVNDTLGHHNGDLLLVEVAHRLRQAVRSGDVIARLGGDEFAVLLPGTGSPLAALRVARTMVGILEDPFDIGGMRIDVGASIGVAVSPDHGTDAGTLMRRADVAMYTAKADQTDANLYEAERDGFSPARLGLFGELRRALHGDELRAWFQPQVDLVTGEVIGAEALVRWIHPERGIIPPDDFVSMAERTGLIAPLTARVLDRALARCRQWHDAGRPIRVSVNLSARSLAQSSVVDDVAAALRRHHLPGSALCLEVTESSVMTDPRRTEQILGRLTGLGITIAIDDFGTGHSSLNYLKRLPVGEIKIDRSFVQSMREDDRDEAIVRSVIDLSRNLGMSVVAEGVEDEMTRDHLTAMGCGLAQGYLYARPLSPDDFAAWLEQGPAAGPAALVVPLARKRGA